MNVTVKYRVIRYHVILKKSHQGSAFQFVVADSFYSITTIKLLCNSSEAAKKTAWKKNGGVRKLVGKIGVRKGSAGSAGGLLESASQEHPEEAKFWRLRANMMFLMMSLRFFKYFFKIASTVAEVIEQNKQNITPKLYVVYSSTL